MTDPRKAIASYNALSAIGEVRSGLPRRNPRKVDVGYMRYSWPSREYWFFIILGEREAWDWVKTLAGPAEFLGSLCNAIRRWYRDD